MFNIFLFLGRLLLDFKASIAFIFTFSSFFTDTRRGHMPCTIIVRNEADFPLVFLESTGTDWINVAPQATVINPGQDTAAEFQLGVPGLFESAYWGWLYFTFELPGAEAKMFLVYTEVSYLSLFDKFGAGPCSGTDSSTRDNPYPQGQFGSTIKNPDYNRMEITINNKDLWSTQLSPERWMSDLAELRPGVLDWPLSKFKYPGQHDAGSFGNRHYSNYALAWSWQCNDKNMYEQAMNGVRWFDLRLCKNGDYFWPFHGFSDRTGDPLTWGPGPGTKSMMVEDTLVHQVLRFLDEQPNEILMIHMKFKFATPIDEVWRTIYDNLGDRLLKPTADGKVPTLRSVRGQQRRLIMFSDHARWRPKEENAWILDYIWDYRNRDLWRGTIWRQAIWDRHDMSLVVKATEDWMRANIDSPTPHIFWWAQCQLTPSFMHRDFFFFPSRSPKELAKDSNPYTREYITNRHMYNLNGSILSMDWASYDENLAIAAMNMADGSYPWDSDMTTMVGASATRAPHLLAQGPPNPTIMAQRTAVPRVAEDSSDESSEDEKASAAKSRKRRLCC